MYVLMDQSMGFGKAFKLGGDTRNPRRQKTHTHRPGTSATLAIYQSASIQRTHGEVQEVENESCEGGKHAKAGGAG
jgi:hypothetical protein